MVQGVGKANFPDHYFERKEAVSLEYVREE